MREQMARACFPGGSYCYCDIKSIPISGMFWEAQSSSNSIIRTSFTNSIFHKVSSVSCFLGIENGLRYKPLTSEAKTPVVNKDRVRISKDWLVKNERTQQNTFETDKQNYLFPKLNLPLDLKTENTSQSPSEHPIKEVIVLQVGKPAFLTFPPKYTGPLRRLYAASSLSCILNATQKSL